MALTLPLRYKETPHIPQDCKLPNVSPQPQQEKLTPKRILNQIWSLFQLQGSYLGFPSQSSCLTIIIIIQVHSSYNLSQKASFQYPIQSQTPYSLKVACLFYTFLIPNLPYFELPSPLTGYYPPLCHDLPNQF